MKKIAVLTSGGDAPGMNAAIRSVIRMAAFMPGASPPEVSTAIFFIVSPLIKMVVSCQLSVVSYQLPVVSYQLSDFRFQISDQSDSSDQISFFVFLLFVLINYIYLLDLQNRVFHR